MVHFPDLALGLRFGWALNTNVHFHTLVAQGVSARCASRLHRRRPTVMWRACSRRCDGGSCGSSNAMASTWMIRATRWPRRTNASLHVRRMPRFRGRRFSAVWPLDRALGRWSCASGVIPPPWSLRRVVHCRPTSKGLTCTPASRCRRATAPVFRYRHLGLPWMRRALAVFGDDRRAACHSEDPATSGLADRTAGGGIRPCTYWNHRMATGVRRRPPRAGDPRRDGWHRLHRALRA